jgi:hypothetical protein
VADVTLTSRLLTNGLFPETLPPCFTSEAVGNYLVGKEAQLSAASLNDRAPAKPIAYSCTKHNASRRSFATPHPLNYFFIACFLSKYWSAIQTFFGKSSISKSIPDTSDEESLRCVKITSFSELNKIAHHQLRHSPYILRADISQFYPSVYTHSVPWAFHSKEAAKKDRKKNSTTVFFNELDYHLRNCQDGQTRGLLVGPDCSRIVAEIVACAVDDIITSSSSKLIVGGIRHVDDYSIGVRSEADAALVLTNLRNALNEFELLPNDEKTRILSAVVPNDAPWPLELQRLAKMCLDDVTQDGIIEYVDEALRATKRFATQSPLKLLLRSMDKYNVEIVDEFDALEPFLLRFVHHFVHTIDYIAMLVASRVLHGESIKKESWHEVINDGIVRYSRLSHHHEVAWLLWLALTTDIEVTESALQEIIRTENSHLIAMVIGAVDESLIKKIPEIDFDTSLDMRSAGWLHMFEGRLAGITKAPFANDELDLFEGLRNGAISFIDFSAATSRLTESSSAISDIRFGYDDDSDDEPEGIAKPNVFQASMTDF